MNSIKAEPSEQNESNTPMQQELNTTTLKDQKIPLNQNLNSSDPEDPTNIETKILDLCTQTPEGINDAVLQNEMSNVSKEKRLAALNRLLLSGKIDLVKSTQSGLLYRLKDNDALQATKGSDVDEKLLYTIIKDSGNKGLWIRELSAKTNLKAAYLHKSLKSLESKKLIKAITNVNAGKRKVYMLYEVEPDPSLTGGAWYSGKEFEGEFVDILNEQIYIYLCDRKSNAKGNDPISKRNASFATSKEIRDYIKNLGISKVDLNIEDIEAILNTLVFDGKTERSVVNNSIARKNECINLYRAINPLLPTYSNDNNLACGGGGSSFVRVPCGICPVIDNCNEDGPISPRTCIYMKQWLEF